MSQKKEPDGQQETTRLNDFSWLSKRVSDWLSSDPEMAVAMAAVRALTEVIKQSKAETMMGLQIDLNKAVSQLKRSHSSISLVSGCELFTRFVTRISLDIPDFQQCKAVLISRGEQFTKKTVRARQKIWKLSEEFIRDGTKVLTCGFSRVVTGLLLNSLRQNKRFEVFVTESRPECSGYKLMERLVSHNIPVTVIPDSSAAYVMRDVDLVLMGAEAVVENGGVISLVGTFQISIVAKAFNKPVYIAAESFKFTRLFPLNQKDIPNREISAKIDKNLVDPKLEGLYKFSNVALDYTPPQYITLLFTDIAVLTPSAVSDELIKLFS